MKYLVTERYYDDGTTTAKIEPTILPLVYTHEARRNDHDIYQSVFGNLADAKDHAAETRAA